MTTDLATIPSKSRGALALQDEQTWWDNRQMAALQQMGVRNASQGDLVVFLHVAQKTGLDPFARQIYMIERAGKQTIQTGIDGFRLIARRSADRLGETLEYEDTLWAATDGTWTDVWLKDTPPVAAKVTVLRSGRRFSAVALFREYAQTNREGAPSAMWARMPSNQLAKCAEALALRKAYPQDLSGIYADEEMGQADRPERPAPPAPNAGTGAERMAAVLNQKNDPPQDTVDAELVPTEAVASTHDTHLSPPAAEAPVMDLRSALARRMFAVLNEAGITADEDQYAYLSKVLGREVTTRKSLTEADASLVIDATEQALADPFGGES